MQRYGGHVGLGGGHVDFGGGHVDFPTLRAPRARWISAELLRPADKKVSAFRHILQKLQKLLHKKMF